MSRDANWRSGPRGRARLAELKVIGRARMMVDVRRDGIITDEHWRLLEEAVDEEIAAEAEALPVNDAPEARADALGRIEIMLPGLDEGAEMDPLKTNLHGTRRCDLSEGAPVRGCSSITKGWVGTVTRGYVGGTSGRLIKVRWNGLGTTIEHWTEVAIISDGGTP